MNLKRRLALLERQTTGAGAIVLHMTDGGVMNLPGDCALGVLAAAVRAERTPQVELVAQSISSTEPDGAHLIDLARAILNTPRDQ
jgi:hypothetical protein